MTSANLKLATVSVLLDDKLETPDQQLDQGEYIVKRVVALKDLDAELKGVFLLRSGRSFLTQGMAL